MEGSVFRLLQDRKLYISACLLFVLWFVSFSFLIVDICEPCVLSVRFLCDAGQICSPTAVIVALRNR